MTDFAIDYSELKGKIKAVCDTQEAFAHSMGMSRSAVSQRLRGAVAWKNREVIKACEVLKIPFTDAHFYFFTKM